ncbi:CCL14 protein, partial [Cochlearius cochlearius]|nr:CCL14 protein [Cochlearius cochlearius]
AHFTATECCFGYAQKVPRRAQSFYKTPSDCSLPAIVLVTSNGNKVCADPSKSWVQNCLKRLQQKK